MNDILNIRLKKGDSIYSRNVDSFTDFGMKQTTTILPNTGVNGIVDINDIFLGERDSCTKYRLTLTINPFCTNILFNMCSEITYDEGSTSQHPVLDNNVENLLNYDIFGKENNVTRSDMVRNTEYSRESVGDYTYHPGMDIFNNHLLRNRTNKVITYMSSVYNQQLKDKFNTLEDYVRDFDGEIVKFAPRKNITNSAPQLIDKHQYTFNDVFPFITGEAYQANIIEDGGWVGFKNTTTVDAKYPDGANGESLMDIGRVINSKGNCEFVDMYPDRSLFLFSPKYNEKRDRLEYNWDIEITYPYRNFYNHPLVRELKTDSNNELIVDENGKYVFGDTYGLLLAYGNAVKVVGNDNAPKMAFRFRSFIKHKMNRGVYFNVYYKMGGKTEYEKYSQSLMVASIGDDERNNSDYFFNVVDDGLYNEMITEHCLDLFYNEIIQPLVVSDYVEYTHKPLLIPAYGVNDKICYYIYEPDPSPLQTYTDDETFDALPYDTYYTPVKIRVVNGNEITYYEKVKHYYELKNTIISNDDILQIATNAFNSTRFRIKRVVSGVESDYYFRVFRKLPNLKFAHRLMDESDVDNGVNFESFVAENASYEGDFSTPVMCGFDNEWYDLAFGKTIYGDQITQLTYTDFIDIDKLVDNLGRPLTSIYATIVKKNCGNDLWYSDQGNYDSDKIEFSHCFGKVTSGVPFLYYKNDRNNEIRRMKGFLSDARMLRNTEIGYDSTELPLPKPLEYWIDRDDSIDGIIDNEFFGDIVDFNPVNAYEITLENVNFRFNTKQRECDDCVDSFVMFSDELISDDYSETGFEVITTTYDNAIIHPEGYIYEPHYEIKVRELSNEIKQDSHYRLNVYSCEPVSLNGMFLRIVTTSIHRAGEGDKIYFCDDNNSVWYESSVVYVPDNKTLIVNVVSPDSENYINWIELTEKILENKIVVRRQNPAIPKYAKRVSVNDFVWREINKVGDLKNVNLEEYPFTNGSFYVDKQINFFLKRQDPDGINKLHEHNREIEIFGDADGLRKTSMENERTNLEDMVC